MFHYHLFHWTRVMLTLGTRLDLLKKRVYDCIYFVYLFIIQSE